MKKVSAVLLIMAVLNPLCCCFAFGEGHQAEAPMKAGHSCCNSESGDQPSNNQDQNAANCEHEETRDAAITANSHVSAPEVSLAALLGQNQEPYDFKYLRRSVASFAKIFEVTQSVPRWVGIQTDCVRSYKPPLIESPSRTPLTLPSCQ